VIHVVIRADAGPTIGVGHVMRCFALAEAMRARGARVEFVSAGVSHSIETRFASHGIAYVAAGSAIWPSEEDVDTVMQRVHAHPGDRSVVVVDGYHFDQEYVARLKRADCTVVWIDDLHAAPAYAGDVVVNPTLGAERCEYTAPVGARVLLGATYALVRSDVQPAPARPADAPRHVIITLGGADPAGLTAPIAAALRDAKFRNCRITVIVGVSNPHAAKIRALAASGCGLAVVEDPADLAALIATADLAVASAGGTAWELARAGVPAVLVVAADNQERGARTIAEAGASITVRPRSAADIGEVVDLVGTLLEDDSRRARMAGRGRRIIDGRGPSRVAQWVTGEAEHAPVRMRGPQPADAIQVWRIASDPGVRAQSFDRQPIDLDRHFDWFDARLQSSSARDYVLESGDEIAAHIRFDRRADAPVADISFAVAAPFRGRGLGRRVLADSWRAACGALAATAARGLVLETNEPSIRAFRGAGFEERRRTVHRGYPCIEFERDAA